MCRPTFGTDLKKYNCNNGEFAHKWKNSPVKEVIKQYKSYKMTLFQTPSAPPLQSKSELFAIGDVFGFIIYIIE